MNLPESQIVTGNTAHSRPENRAFYPALDGLRAIAFVMVFLQHYIQMPWGWTGVNIFFVLSGFLITGILLDSREQAHRARNFYVRRTLRIFPLYYGIFLLVLLLSPILHWDWYWPWLAWPLYLGNFLRFFSPHVMVLGSLQNLAADGHLQTAIWPHQEFNLGHFWSLCVEEQFYLVWPWIVFWTRKRRSLFWVCLGTVILIPLLRLLAQSRAPAWMVQQELLYRATPFQLDALLLGGLLALLWRGTTLGKKPMRREPLLRAGRWCALLCAAAAASYLTLTLHVTTSQWRLHYVYPTWRLTWGLSFVNVFTAALILCCLEPTSWIARILTLRPLRWVGRISYGAYVFHDVLRVSCTLVVARLRLQSGFIAAHTPGTIALFGLTATLGLAALSFRFFESPFLDLKERWTISEKTRIVENEGVD